MQRMLCFLAFAVALNACLTASVAATIAAVPVAEQVPAIPLEHLFGRQSVSGAEGGSGDEYGSAIAIEGNLALIGVPNDGVGSTTYHGAVYAFFHDGNGWVEEQKLLASGAPTSRFFGTAVAISGNTAVIGAHRSAPAGPGLAYVFEREADAWVEKATLIGHDTTPDDLFGASVAIDGDRIVVGSIWAHIGGNGQQGAAYVFERSGRNWVQTSKLVADDGTGGAQFATAIAIGGDRIIVGAPYQSGGGSVYSYTNTGGGWSPSGQLLPAASSSFSRFGMSLAVDGNRAIVGAPLGGVGGSAHLFERVGDDWLGAFELQPTVPLVGVEFGSSVALLGDRAIVAATNTDEGGALYVYDYTGTIWLEQTRITNPNGLDNDDFGNALALTADFVMASNRSATELGGDNQGAVNAYDMQLGWGAMTRLHSGTGATDQAFGSELAIDGDTAVVAVSGRASRRGYVVAYVYVREGVRWLQQGVLSAPEFPEWSALSVAIHQDTILVGVHSQDVGSNDAQGAVFVFNRENADWSYTTTLTATDGDTGDHFGKSVAVRGDLAWVGAERDYTTVREQGSVYLFQSVEGNWAPKAKILAIAPEPNARFGNRLAFDGQTLAISAPGEHNTSNVDRGAVYVYTRVVSTWVLQDELYAADNQGFYLGQSLSLEGDSLIAGGLGYARVFVRNGAAWSEQATLQSPLSDHISVAIWNNLALVGIQRYGVIYQFERVGESWGSAIDIGPIEGREFAIGAAIDINDTATLISAPNEPGSIPYGNPKEGVVYVYQLLDDMFADDFE